MALIIGLTGSIGTGKSTISKMFQELKIPVVDADLIAREVVEPGRPAYKKIVEHFGEDILLEDKTLDRVALGSIVFSDEEQRKQLNNIVHPAIREEMDEQKNAHIAAGHKCVVMDIPLLYEGSSAGTVDKVIVVAVTPELQLTRVTQRDESTDEDALARINSQIPITEKVKLADAVIDNNGTIEASKEQLLEILDRWEVLE